MLSSIHLQRIVIVTGSELRHHFFRKWLALHDSVEVLQTYCEGVEKGLGALVEKEADNRLRVTHLRAREQSEQDFFRLFVDTTEDLSQPIFLAKGEINLPAHAEAIRQLKPDLLIAYGCSLIREPLLSAFPGRFLNVHLGLSPYYRGSGTNFWPLVNGEPEFVGATFMQIDAGVDTGEVVHQIRARVAPGDSPVQIGNRLIVDTAALAGRLIVRFADLKRVAQIAPSPTDRFYRKKDYTEESVARLYENFRNGLVDRYLEREAERCAAVTLVRNPALLAA